MKVSNLILKLEFSMDAGKLATNLIINMMEAQEI